MSKNLKRTIAVLDLFNVDRPFLTIEAVITNLGLTRPTAYRYVRQLYESGFLSRFRGGFTLGPRAIQLDYLIRRNDPLLGAGIPVLNELQRTYGCDVTLLTIYDDKVVCIHHVEGTDPTIKVFGRGEMQPLFLGAGPKVLLASLSPAVQRKLYEANRESTKSKEFSNLESYLSRLKEIRRAGYAVSEAELHPDTVGIATPVSYGIEARPGAIVMIVSRQRYALMDKEAAGRVIRGAADKIRTSIANQRAQSSDAIRVS